MRQLTLAAAFLLALPMYGARPERAEIDRIVAELEPKLIECRREFHMHPELSNRERDTATRIARRLSEIGIPHRTSVAGHGVIAEIRGAKEGSVVAVRADIDALPITETIDVPYRSKNQGVKHACGHDAHLTVGLGTAEVLWNLRRELQGTVYVIFQPAEEGPPPGEEGGAKLMVAEGLVEELKPEAFFSLHAMPEHEVGVVSWTSGPEMASSDRFRIDVTGRQSHGAAPHHGIDTIYVASQIVGALQTIDSRRIDPLLPVVVSVGRFQAGTRWNIIPETAELHGTVRTLSPEVRRTSLRLVEQLARDVAKAHGATAVTTFDLGIPVLINDPALGEWSERSLIATLGPGAVKRDPPRMIAEDFAFFAEKVPSFYYFLGVANETKGITAGLHTPEFDIDEAALAIGVRTMTNLVLDYLSEPPGR